MTSLHDQLAQPLRDIWSRRWQGLAVMWGVCVLGWIVVAMIPNKYQSSARLYVDWGSLLPEQLGYRGNNVLRQVDVVRRTLTSRINLEKVVRRVDMADGIEDPKKMDAVIESLSKNIDVKAQEDDLFTISYVSASPALSDAQNAAQARRIVDNLIQIFMEENLASDRDDINEAVRFFEDQLTQRERELEAAEKRKMEFEQRYLGRLPGDGAIGQRLMDARNELERVNMELAQTRNALAALQGQLSGTAATIDAPAMIFGGGERIDTSSPQGRIAQLESDISAALARGWTEQHPDVIAMRNQIKRLEQQKSTASGAASAQRAAQSNPVYVNLRSMIFEKQSSAASLSARAAQLRSDIAEMTSKQTEEPGIAAEQAKLNRDYDVLRQQYEQLLKAREGVRLRSDVETKTQQVKFRVVDPPTLPRLPIAPNRPLLLSLVLFMAVGAGVLGAFLLSRMHSTYANAQSLQSAYGVPVLGSITEIITPQKQMLLLREKKTFLSLAIGLLGIYSLLLLVELGSRAGVTG